ncbi:MAG: ATP-binding protein [Spirochaetales bacterium]|nr:ATP-binding protein [Spirochaetales bacterium]
MNALIQRDCRTSASSFFLFGPRGTGKSTWLKIRYPNAYFIDFLKDDIYRTIVTKPETIEEIVHGNPGTETFILDEVQKVPVVLNTIHRLMEENKGLQFILTGSSSRKLKRPGADMLAGRALFRKMYPFTASELEDSFSIEKALQFGMIPLVHDREDKPGALNAYVSLYLKEEVQLEGLVRDIGSFSRFLEVMSFSHGQLLNYSEIARECQVKRNAVENYTDILEDLLLAYRIPPFSKRAKRILVKSSKFYYFDPGVYNTLRPKGPLDRPEETGGCVLEGIVLHHLLAWVEYGNVDAKVSFWRTKSGNEVDFILYGANLFIALEVKHSKTIRKVDLHGLKAFRQDYPEAACALLYLGNMRMMVDDIPCIPCGEFLKKLKPDVLITDQYLTLK